MNWIIAGCMITVVMLNAEPSTPEDDGNKAPLIIHNTNTIKVENKRDPRDCTACVGSEFKACMRSLTKEDFVNNLSALHPRACTAYVQQLKKDEMIEIGKMFTAQEWQALPEVFTQAMVTHFKGERERTIDAWYDKMLSLLVSISLLDR